MLKLSQEEFLHRVYATNPNIDVLSSYVNAKTKIHCKCKICGYIWEAFPDNIFRGHGCRKCAWRKLSISQRKTQQEYINKVADVNPDIEVVGDYIRNDCKIAHKCKKCGYGSNDEWLISPVSIWEGRQCPVCMGKIIGPAPEYQNSIWASEYKEYFSKYMTEDQMKKYKPNSANKITLPCPNCRQEKPIIIRNLLHQGFGCICGDGQSYANKFVHALLMQLKIPHITEYTPSWLKDRKYDIYISQINCIIENHGIQHYDYRGQFTTRTIEEEQQNDQYKQAMAFKNGIKNYIILDCRKSKQEYLQQSIMSSDLVGLLGLSNAGINWQECDEFAVSNVVKTVAGLWNSGLSIKEIKQQTLLSQAAIYNYLQKGNMLSWCKYFAEESCSRGKENIRGKNHWLSRKVIRLSDKAIYDTCSQAGIENNIPLSSIIRYCKKHRDFMYYDEWTAIQSI